MFITANFLVGTLVGAVSTYIYKDRAARDAISAAGSKASNDIKSLLAKKEAAGEHSEEPETAGEAVAETAVQEQQEDSAEKPASGAGQA